MKIKKIAAFAAACVVIMFGVWACSDYAGRDAVVPSKKSGYQQTVARIIEATYNAGGSCKVKSDCTGWTCTAKITCGCDESPRCSCGVFICQCDCEGKEKVSVEIPSGQYDNLLVLSSMLQNMTSPASQMMYQASLSYISAFSNNDYNLYLTSAQIMESNLYHLSQPEKNILNNWFASIGASHIVIN